MPGNGENQESLIESIYLELVERSSLSSATVDAVNFRKEFIVVRLHCGSIGLSGNCEFRRGKNTSRYNLQENWNSWLAEQARDWEEVWQKALSLPWLLRNGVRVALLSVLSQLSLIRFPRATTYLKSPKSVYDFHHDRSYRTLGYIGMGEKLELVLTRASYDEVHISDFNIHDVLLKDYLSSLPSKFPKISFVFTDGSRNEELIRECDLILVTASAIINGTIQPILENAREEKTDVCLFGISGNIPPDAFFRYGVKAISTIEVPPSCWQSVAKWLDLDEVGGIERFDTLIPYCEMRFIPHR